MFVRSIDVPVNTIHGLGLASSALLSKLGIKTAASLLMHYPRDWQDRTDIKPLASYNSANVSAVVKVFNKEWIGFGRMKALKVYIEDESAQGSLLFYNQPWMDKQLEEGTRLYINGKFRYKYGEIQSSYFDHEIITDDSNYNEILPVYPLTSGLKQKQMRNFISTALKKYENEIEDELPLDIINKYNLLSKKEAIKEIHLPSSMEKLQAAKKTIIYEELFFLEVMVARRVFTRKSVCPKKTQEEKKEFSSLQKYLLERLPFELTNGQTEAIYEINKDIESSVPMARLLQGDVGCGKTLVSFMAALKVLQNKGQCAIMAPTELLARQHAENAAKLLEPMGIKIAYLTGNIKAAGRKELVKNLKDGTIDIVVGTHALFSKDVEYKNLKLVIIDEQHRFGVTQRSLVMSKGENSGLLMMSATPIPRSLALTIFGDMDVSVIKDLPAGRKPIITHLAKGSNEKKVYDFVRKELDKGRQAYFVYPLIDEGEEIKDAVSMADRLSKEIFPKHKTAVIHSKIAEDEKKLTMDNFRKGEIKILAATSVVEVGVDVPNAVCMVIEHAERFGLSALHQLRGRVGRGGEQSYCFLVYSDELTDDGKTRLKVMLENNDGFAIAEEDLKMRGPGQITGTEQAGYLALGLSNPIRDIQILEKAREDVFFILENDPDFLLENHSVIARVLEEAPPFGAVAL